MIIKMGTDRFWVRVSNIERWADILSTLPERIPCKNKKDIAKDYLHYKVDEGGRIINADEVYGLFGVEKSKTSVTIVGSNFIKENDDCYELTEGAINLLNNYKHNAAWEKTLGEQLLKYSLRVRTLALALLNGGYLYFEKGYMENFTSAYINYENIDYHIFSSKSEDININNLLNVYSSKVLGPFWKEELNIIDDEIIQIQGVNKEEPSLGSMSTYLKIPMMLFEYLNWLKEEADGKYILDKHKIKEDISEEIFNSLIFDVSLDDMEVLKELIVNNSDARGFFSLEIVGSFLKDKIDSGDEKSYDQWIDHYFMSSINEGRLRIVDHEQGQPRHGRGLFGKKDYQLIKLEIVN
ncbi:hypothetical protein [Anaeromicropila herbilytica]|uniref:Uncharacterized protein n=1 Tax=Anaeromicropila herbilytica TaxID=2785025 RepID=A0A7R7EJV2_9FIRM|nr:hypothetical protein [Anaeromicropila herbilytica]BCN30117.1 hypothetical protein bsdtb5_14120 [Anaeromicropila herbilytica]